MSSATNTMYTTHTGDNDIAGMLSGRIRDGSLTIIEGDHDSGKSVLSQSLAHGALYLRENTVVYYTVGNTDSDLIGQMDSLSLNATHYFVTDRLRIHNLSSPIGNRDAQRFIRILINQILELPARFNLIIVDSITPVMTSLSPTSKINLLLTFKELCSQGRSVLLVANTHVFENGTLLRAYLMSDYYLRLRSEVTTVWAGHMDNRIIKALEVLKLGSIERQKGEYIKFEIRPGVGIRFLPFVKIRI